MTARRNRKEHSASRGSSLRRTSRGRRSVKRHHHKQPSDADLFLHGASKDVAGDVLIIGGLGLAAYLMGKSLWNMAEGNGPSPLNGMACARLGDAQGAQIGGELGSIIGQVVPIPGISQVASFIGGLFGPSVHYTPSGLTFPQSFCAFWTAYFEMYALTNQIRAALKLSPVQPQSFVGNCTPTPNYGGSVSDHNNPMFGPLLANLLDDPSYASATTADAIIALQKAGVVDSGTAMMKQIIQHLQFTQQALGSGLLVPVNGVLMPATATPPPPPPPSSYDAQTGTNPYPPSGSYDDMQYGGGASMMPAPFLSPYTSDTGQQGYYDPENQQQYLPNASGQYVDSAGGAMPTVPQTAAPVAAGLPANIQTYAIIGAAALAAILIIRRI